MVSAPGTLQRAVQRDDLYMSLLKAGIAPERAYEIVEHKLPYAPTSSVRSDALTNGKPVARRRIHWDRLPLAVFGYLIFGLWGAAGGKWTIDGTPLLINEVFNFFHISFRLAPITWPGWYAWLIWLPIGISFVEHRYAPWRAWGKWGILSLLAVVAVWFVVSSADWGSTWLAITHPADDAWLVAQQVAAMKPVAAVWVTLTTFIPEIGIALLYGWLWEPEHKR